MYSMNRSSKPWRRANVASGTTSFSVRPRIETAFSRMLTKTNLLGRENAVEHALQAFSPRDSFEGFL